MWDCNAPCYSVILQGHSLDLCWSTTVYFTSHMCLPHCVPPNGFRTKLFKNEKRGRKRASKNNLNKEQYSYLDRKSLPYPEQYLTSNIVSYFSFHSNLKALVVPLTQQGELCLRLLQLLFSVLRTHFPRFLSVSVWPHPHSHSISLTWFIWITLFTFLYLLNIYDTLLIYLSSVQLNWNVSSKRPRIFFASLFSQYLIELRFKICSSLIYYLNM